MTKETVAHSERAHAKLSPSSSARWLNCPGSMVVIPIFEEKMLAAGAKVRNRSRNSDEGTLCHEVSEQMLLGQDVVRPDNPYEAHEEPLTDDEWEDILGHSLGFREYVRGLMDEGDLLLLEKRVKVQRVDPTGDIFGTADVIIFKHKTGALITVDLKYGRSYVHPSSPQLKLYLVGAAELMLEMGHKVNSYEAHIYQPRVAGGIGAVGYTHEEIYEFTTQAREAVARIRRGDVARIPGEKQCAWCPVSGTEFCPESVDWVSKDVLALIDELEDFSDVCEIDPKELKARDCSSINLEQLGKMFLLFPAAKKWMERVEEYLGPLAAEGKVPGLMLAEGRGRNECIDPAEVEFIVGPGAMKPPKEPELKSVTDLKKLVGAKNFEALLGDCYKKVPGSPKLMSENANATPIASNAMLIAQLDDYED